MVELSLIKRISEIYQEESGCAPSVTFVLEIIDLIKNGGKLNLVNPKDSDDGSSGPIATDIADHILDGIFGREWFFDKKKPGMGFYDIEDGRHTLH